MIQIMHILPSLEIGGMENGVVNLLNGIDRSIFKPYICCLEKKGRLESFLKYDVEVCNLEQKEGLQILLPFKLMRLFKSKKIDIVHTHNFATSLYGIIGAKLARIHVVIHGEHGTIGEDKQRRKIIAKYLSNFVQCIIVVSESLKDILVNIGIKSERIVVVVNGVDLAKDDHGNTREQLRKDLGLNLTDLVVGAVGRMVPLKNFALLIESISEVIKIIPSAKLLLIGDGPLLNELESMVKHLGLSNKVFFLGYRNNVQEIMKTMDVFVLPSSSEGMSNVILEAMAVKLPVIATNVGDNPKLVKDGETGLMVPVGNVDALTKAVKSILSDNDTANKMGKAGFSRIENQYTLQKMIKSYENVYKYWAKISGVLYE